MGQQTEQATTERMGVDPLAATTKDTGGAAFPVLGMRWHPQHGFHDVAADGMALRDYFAAKAMAAMLGSDKVLTLTDSLADSPDFHRGNWIAGQAYAFADSMLAARKEAT